MKLRDLLASVLASPAWVSAETIDWSDLVKRNGLFCKKFTNIPFTDRASWFHPCPTITASGQQIGQGGICHPDEDRLFTVNELKRLMTLPDSYSMRGPWNSKVLSIGNMVPPRMMSALATSLYERLILPAIRSIVVHDIQATGKHAKVTL